MQTDSRHISFLLSKDIKIMEKEWKEIGANNSSIMVIFQILLLSDKRVISKERNTVRASNPRASLTWTDNTSKVGYDKINKMICAPSKDPDPPSLIKVFAIRMKNPWVLSYPCSARGRLWSDWVDTQADLSLRWAHRSFGLFCHALAHQ